MIDLVGLDRELLALFRANPHADVAERLVRVAALAHEVAPTEPADDDPAHLHRLAMPYVRTMPNVRDRLRPFEEGPPDPRVGTWIVAELARGGLTQLTGALLLDALLLHGSEAIVRALRHLDVHDVERQAEVLARWSRPADPLAAPLRTQLATVDEALDRFEASPRVALERAARAPTREPGAVGVLADRLCEEGDPRGEFLQLQLLHARGEGDARSRKAEARLFRKHVRSWFPDVACVLGPRSSTCRLGALDRLGLQLQELAPLDRVFASAGFATVREVVAPPQRGREVLELLPGSVEAIWNLDYGPFRAVPTRSLRSLRRAGIAGALEAPELAEWLACLGEVEVLALDLPALDAWVDLERAPAIPTLCVGRGEFSLDDAVTAVRRHGRTLERRGVREVRLGGSGLEAWDAPERVLRP